MNESTSNVVELAGVGRSVLDELLRHGAQEMLTAAIAAEVSEYIESRGHLVDETGALAVALHLLHGNDVGAFNLPGDALEVEASVLALTELDIVRNQSHDDRRPLLLHCHDLKAAGQIATRQRRYKPPAPLLWTHA